MDIVGWDIKKALNLHFKGNPSLREWLMSSQIYINRGIEHIFDDLGDFDKNVLKNHYSSIAIKDWRKYSALKFNKTKTKKYLYVIRSILCWNILDNNQYPPLSIDDLLDHESNNISEDLKCDIRCLIAYYQDSGGIDEDIIFRLNNFILKSIKSMEKVKIKNDKNFEVYDERFRELLLVC